MTGICGDGVGTGYIWFAPTGTSPVTADKATVESAYTAYAATMNSATFNKSEAYKGA